MKLLSAFLVLLLSLSVARAESSGYIANRIFSPFGLSTKLGVDPFGSTLLDQRERKRLEYNLYQQEVFSELAEQKSSADFIKLAGYGAKGLGYGTAAAGGTVGGAFGFANPIAGGLISTGSAIAGGYAQDYGQSLLTEADQVVATRVAISLDRRYGDVIKDGTVDRLALRRIGDTKLGQLLHDPKFIEEVGNPALLADLKGTITISMLETSLGDTSKIKLDVSTIDREIKELDRGYSAIKNLQAEELQQSQINGAAIGRVEQNLANTDSIVQSIATSTLPPGKVLQLFRAGVLGLDEKEVQSFELRVTAQTYRENFDDAATVFRSVSSSLTSLGVAPDVAKATDQFGSLLTSGGAFAAAVTLGDPISIFSSGASLLGAVTGLFGKKHEDPSQKMLREIYKELGRLSEQIAENHRQQMAALQHISSQIDSLQDLVIRRFADLGLDVAVLQVDTRELLYEDVRVCEKLADEFVAHPTQKLIAKNISGFEAWFDRDNRAEDYARCLNGLMARQRVSSEIDYSGMLRADTLPDSEPTANFADRRTVVRRMEQRVLGPTVGYIRKYAAIVSGEELVTSLYSPHFDICDAYRDFSQAKVGPGDCWLRPKAPRWPRTRLAFSQFNPGQGALLSAATAILMAKYTRVIAPWNGVLIDRPNEAVAHVMFPAEMRSLSKQNASLRTRHLRTINSAIDALDLNIGQGQVLAGLPVVARATDVLDRVVIPAYAKARLLGKPEELNKLLAALPPYAGSTGADCSISALASGSENTEAWNTLCLMENNPEFAKNVIRALVSLRLDRSNVPTSVWRRDVRSPFSLDLSSDLGNDIIVNNAAEDLKNSTYGLWAIELPRVYSDPSIAPNKADSPGAKSCWAASAVPRIDDESQKDFYRSPSSSRCYLLDPFDAESFTEIDFPVKFRSLLSERVLNVGVLTQLCKSNKYYPRYYCTFSDNVH